MTQLSAEEAAQSDARLHVNRTTPATHNLI